MNNNRLELPHQVDASGDKAGPVLRVPQQQHDIFNRTMPAFNDLYNYLEIIQRQNIDDRRLLEQAMRSAARTHDQLVIVSARLESLRNQAKDLLDAHNNQ